MNLLQIQSHFCVEKTSQSCSWCCILRRHWKFVLRLFRFENPFADCFEDSLPTGEIRVGTSSDERALSFPTVWGRNRARSVSVPETSAARYLRSDEEVMARLQANDSNALNFLFDRYARLVLRIAFRILHEYGEAEGVVQEAFFHVFQKAMLFDPSKGTAKD